MRSVVCAVMLVMVAACSPPAAQAPAATASAASASSGFDIALTFSPAAKVKLSEINEKVNVAAMYWGEPGAAATAKADEMGQIDLGREDIVVEPIDQTVAVTGSGLQTAALGDIKGAPLVLVNIYTARKVAPDNLLDCGIFEGPVPATTAAIHCKLIAEE